MKNSIKFIAVLLFAITVALGYQVQTAQAMVYMRSEVEFYEELKDSPIPVLVDFEASWCEQCRRIKPLFEQWADKYYGKVKFIAVDVDELSEVSEKEEISEIPTFKLFKGGNLVGKVLGASESKVLDMLGKA